MTPESEGTKVAFPIGTETGSGRAVRRRWPRRLGCGCAGLVLLFLAALGTLVLALMRVPSGYPIATTPVPAPTRQLGGGLDGFGSPYLGHTGSWDGKGGAWGGSKIADLDKERAMGLRWTFMPVYWRVMEPEGPVDLGKGAPPAWEALDRFVIAAHGRGLNILMQAPVVGGNAGGPPSWAGRREAGKSAPADMAALAAFAWKLAERYRPDGTLPGREGWGTRYGVRAWELDNEPESYRTSWKGQAADYAEFAGLAAARIKAADPLAVIVGPGMSAGKDGLRWLAAALDPDTPNRSPAAPHRAGNSALVGTFDVVSFHDYEGLDSAFASGPRTVVQVLEDVSSSFRRQASGITPEYWHTEGNFDFLGLLSAPRRAAWRWQFFTRAFSAGVRKACVMDASPLEQVAVRAYVSALPNPFPMLLATNEVTVLRGRAMAFLHPDSEGREAGRVWILWAVAGAGDTTVLVPTIRPLVDVMSVQGKTERVRAVGSIRLELPGDTKMAPGIIVVDR